MSNLDKAAVRRELEAAWAELRALVESLPEGELEQPGVVDGWSVKDLLGHIAFWTGKAANDLRAVAAGRVDEVLTPGDEAGVDDWNAREAERRRDLSLKEVHDEWRKSFDEARAALEAVPAEALDVEVKGWTMAVRFAEDTYKHYHEHAEHIRAWQRQLETTEA